MVEKPESQPIKLPPILSGGIKAPGYKGAMKEDWVLRHVGKDGQLVLERIEENGEPHKKTIFPDEYHEWNPEPVAEPVSRSGTEPEPDFNPVRINVEGVKDYLLGASDDVRNKFTERLDSLFSLLAADPSMANNPEQYSLKITDAHTGLAVLNSSKEIEIGIDVLLQDDKPIDLVERTIMEGIHSSFKNEPPAQTEEPAEATGKEEEDTMNIEVSPEPSKARSRYDFWIPPKAEPTPEPQPEQKEKLPSLDEAREAYVKAHREYREANKGKGPSMLNIGGDTSAVTEARATYDAALKAATQAERERLMAESDEIMESEKKNPLKWRSSHEINRELFDKFIVDEERKMAALKISEMPEQKQSLYKKAWVAYARLPQWKKMLISTTISTGVGLAAGGGVGVLYRRAVSPFASAGAGFLTNMGFGAYDKTIGRKNTKEYQIDKLLWERGKDISKNLDDMRLQYSEILQNQADREKKRMYLRIAIAAAAGATVSGIIAHNMPSGGGVADHRVSVGRERLMPSHNAPIHESGTHAIEHPATTPSHPAETPPVPKAPEHVPTPAPSVEHLPIEVHKGDSLWEITAKELQKDPGFDKLNDAQKTWMISSIVDRAVEHKDALHIANPDALAIGEKIDLSSVLKDGDVHGLMERAGHLTAAQQEHILANNHAIASWLHAHPHEQLTTARLDEILHPHGAGGIPHHSEITTERPPDLNDTIPLHHLENLKLAPQHVQVGDIAEQIHRMAPNPDHGQLLVERIDGMDRIPPIEMRQLLLIAAERVGDHHPLLIDMNNVAEVHRQIRDYLVSYPRAQEFGFRSYDHWARVRDVPVRRFAEDTTISPRPEALQSALRHSFFHRGASVHEMQDGALRRVPLEERHANLGMALRGNSELVRRAPETTTVGDFVAAHHGTIRRK